MLLLASCVLVRLAAAGDWRDVQINKVEFRRTSVADALQFLGQQYRAAFGVDLPVSVDVAALNKRVSLSLDGVSLAEAYQRTAAAAGLTVSVLASGISLTTSATSSQGPQIDQAPTRLPQAAAVSVRQVTAEDIKAQWLQNLQHNKPGLLETDYGTVGRAWHEQDDGVRKGEYDAAAKLLADVYNARSLAAAGESKMTADLQKRIAVEAAANPPFPPEGDGRRIVRTTLSEGATEVPSSHPFSRYQAEVAAEQEYEREHPEIAINAAIRSQQANTDRLQAEVMDLERQLDAR